jgi:hypothetical protein
VLESKGKGVKDEIEEHLARNETHVIYRETADDLLVQVISRMNRAEDEDVADYVSAHVQNSMVRLGHIKEEAAVEKWRRETREHGKYKTLLGARHSRRMAMRLVRLGAHFRAGPVVRIGWYDRINMIHGGVSEFLRKGFKRRGSRITY